MGRTYALALNTAFGRGIQATWAATRGTPLVAGALEPRVRAAASVFPFLSDYQRVWEMDLATAAYEELRAYLRRHDPTHEDVTAMWRTLAKGVVGKRLDKERSDRDFYRFSVPRDVTAVALAPDGDFEVEGVGLADLLPESVQPVAISNATTTPTTAASIRHPPGNTDSRSNTRRSSTKSRS